MADTAPAAPTAPPRAPDNAALVDVLPAHRFDEAKLRAYLRAVTNGGMEDLDAGMTVRQFQGGQSNPTFLLETPDRRYVLRKKPPGVLLPSAHQVEREYRILSALQDTDVPVPETLLLCEDPEIIGTPFYVMAHVPGRVIARPETADLAPAERHALVTAMITSMAALHRVNWRAAGLADFGRHEDYLARQTARWAKQYRASIIDAPDPAMEALCPWLENNRPSRSTVAIAHGDFRMGNLIYASEGPTVSAILDWELSTLGDPLADLAYCCLPYHLPGLGAETKGYVGHDLKALGLPEESEVLATYCRLTGRDGIEHWTYYLAFSLFRLAAILHGVRARALRGNASSANALEMGKRASLLSSTGQRLAMDRSVSH